MNDLRTFWSYYIRSALPFASGLAFGLFQERLGLPLPLTVLVGLALVVAGPATIQVVLTLLAEALNGDLAGPSPDAGPPNGTSAPPTDLFSRRATGAPWKRSAR